MQDRCINTHATGLEMFFSHIPWPAHHSIVISFNSLYDAKSDFSLQAIQVTDTHILFALLGMLFLLEHSNTLFIFMVNLNVFIYFCHCATILFIVFIYFI